MNRAVIFAPLVALIIFAGYLGLRTGQIPSDTEIIDHYVAAYLAIAQDGALPTDCVATPHRDDAIRMVIRCTHESGLITTYFVGPRGAALPEPGGPQV